MRHNNEGNLMPVCILHDENATSVGKQSEQKLKR